MADAGEHSGPGRPPIGPAAPVRLGEELTARADALAEVEGVSRAEVIRRAVEAYVDAPASAVEALVRVRRDRVAVVSLWSDGSHPFVTLHESAEAAHAQLEEVAVGNTVFVRSDFHLVCTPAGLESSDLRWLWLIVDAAPFVRNVGVLWDAEKVCRRFGIDTAELEAVYERATFDNSGTGE